MRMAGVVHQPPRANEVGQARHLRRRTQTTSTWGFAGQSNLYSSIFHGIIASVASNNIDRLNSQPPGRTLSRKHYGVCLGSRPLGLCPGEASTPVLAPDNLQHTTDTGSHLHLMLPDPLHRVFLGISEADLISWTIHLSRNLREMGPSAVDWRKRVIRVALARYG